MNTNQLIDQLGEDLSPVQPLLAPGRRAFLWLLGSAAYIFVAMVAIAALMPSSWAFDPGFVGTQFLGVLAAVLAAWAAFTLVVPGRSWAVPAVAVLVVVVWLAAFVSLASSRDGAVNPAPQEEWLCVAIIFFGGAPLVLSLGVMLRKGAPLNPAQSGIFVGIAVSLLTNFAACLATVHNDMSLALFWHVGAIGALVFVCTLGGRMVLSWRRNT